MHLTRTHTRSQKKEGQENLPLNRSNCAEIPKSPIRHKKSHTHAHWKKLSTVNNISIEHWAAALAALVASLVAAHVAALVPTCDESVFEKQTNWSVWSGWFCVLLVDLFCSCRRLVEHISEQRSLTKFQPRLGVLVEIRNVKLRGNRKVCSFLKIIKSTIL